MGVVWIASYPKSGNTWMRFLLANYLAGPIDNSGSVDTLIPDLMRRLDLTELLGQQPVVYSKTHYMWHPNHPYAARTDRAVVIIRHPKDVLLSNLNYHKLERGMERAFTDEAYARSFVMNGGDARWARTGIGTLERNLDSWLNPAPGPPRLVIRYEDMKSDTARELARVISFLGLPLEAARVEMAVMHSSFDRMRAIEVREKLAKKFGPVFPGSMPRLGWARYFMNQGQSRASLKHLNPDLDAAFDRRFGPLVQRLGYTTSS